MEFSELESYDSGTLTALSKTGDVNRTLNILVLGLGALEVRATMSLSEKQRQRLLAERDR